MPYNGSLRWRGISPQAHHYFPCGIFSSFKTCHPDAAGALAWGRLVWVCFTTEHGDWETRRNSSHWKVDCFHTLPHAFRSRRNTMKAIFPVLTPRFSSIAPDDDNAHSVVFYCSVGSPGMRLCAWQNNILDFFWGIDLRTPYILTYCTSQHFKKQQQKHWKMVTKARVEAYHSFHSQLPQITEHL